MDRQTLGIMNGALNKYYLDFNISDLTQKVGDLSEAKTLILSLATAQRT